MALTGLAAEVTKPMVQVLLLERDPGILDKTMEDPEDPQPVFDVYVRQVTAEVVAIVGTHVKGDARELALQCIAYGVGSVIEYAEFPEEQSAGDSGRGWYLHQRFKELKEMLRTLPSSGDGGGGTGISRARSPKPRPYPDPIRWG